ncbi:hypothetical protein B0H13DRAFT_2303823 [Mycena leptocephala]|nr:hypothetical protein B0H13DRAFT_2303823 [Mycena leptocephala]
MGSPFENILNTNIVPSDSECQKIRDFLDGPRKEVDDLTEELARLDALRENISQKRRELQQVIDVHLAFAVARTLPSGPKKHLFSCGGFVDLGEALPLRRHVSGRLFILSSQTNRDFITSRIGTCNAGYDISPLLSSLVAVSRRWKTIEIPSPLSEDPDAGSPLLSLTAEHVPLLETVKIGDPNLTSLLFLANNSIRRLTLPATRHWHEIPVSWASLTHLKITHSRHYLTGVVALAILRQGDKV